MIRPKTKGVILYLLIFNDPDAVKQFRGHLSNFQIVLILPLIGSNPHPDSVDVIATTDEVKAVAIAMLVGGSVFFHFC